MFKHLNWDVIFWLGRYSYKGRAPQLCARKRQDARDKGAHDTQNTSLLFHSSVRLLITVFVGAGMLLRLFCMTSEERGEFPATYTFRQHPHAKCTACFMKSSFIFLSENIFGNVSLFSFSLPNVRSIWSEAHQEQPTLSLYQVRTITYLLYADLVVNTDLFRI